MRKTSARFELHFAAKMRIEDLFVDAQCETGEGIPTNVRTDIDDVINDTHKTFRYMLVTGLLAAVTDMKLHPRCLQVTSVVDGAFWDETQWEFDPASGVNTAKQYADGSRISYDYTDNGQRTRTTWARGAWKQHAYNDRNLVSGTTYSGTATPSVAYTYDDSDKMASATLSDGTSYAYTYDDNLLCTNEAMTIAEDNFTVMRTYDSFQRNEETAVVITNIRHATKRRLYDSENRVCGYALTNSYGRGMNVSLRYDGSYLTNMVYSLPNGNQFALNLSRKVSRQELVTLQAYSYGAQPVYWYSTDYDLIGRPTNATDSLSLMREWLYNNRSELAAASIGTNLYGYSYDTIGNRLWSADNVITNEYAANSLNQYTLVGRAAPSTPQTSLFYDTDGNMTRDGAYTYSYDAENRLRTVTSRSMTNGALRVLNAYDHRNRRIRKIVQRLHSTSAPPPAPPSGTYEWQTLETHTFVWDGNNIVLEKVEFSDGTVRTFEYFWGMDKSGTEQGAGGVGGLLAVSMDGIFYIPCYDHNGNIVLYVSETGAIAAQYTYDPYGNIIESSGPIADVFSFGFSTKYHDRETGMVGYKRRFYRPDLGRWLNRDPIEEEGGENLYAFCGNNAIHNYDKEGCAYFAYRPLNALRWIGVFGTRQDDIDNTYAAHENLFFEDGKSPSNLGYFSDGLHPDPDNHGYNSPHASGFDDCVMRKAVARVRPLPYSLLGGTDRVKYNCQDWAEEVRMMYYAIKAGKTYYPKSTTFIGGK